MTIQSVALAALAATLTIPSLPTAQPTAARGASDEVVTPPGLVLVRGGRFEIGAEKDFVVGLVEEEEAFGATLSAELGGKSVSLPDFWLMPTEVTNEQYAAFVRASGHRPPQDWADPEALSAAIRAFAEEQNARIQEAREAGRAIPERKEFDITRWFDANWQDLSWEVPRGKETHPVTWVDHADARAYTEWAGLSLMTEFEFQAAARGTGNRAQWPWGDTWDADKAVSLDSYRSQLQAVGTTGWATESGLHDLIGNVWEWTDSPFVAYEDFEPLEVEFKTGRGKRTEVFMAEFDPNNRVAVGGSADYDEFANRISVRRNTARNQRTEKLGFRCAAHAGSARDRLDATIRDMRGALRTEDPLAPEFGIALHRWRSSPGKANLDGYAVIEGYDYIAIAPVKELDVSNISQLAVRSLEEGPVGFGILTTSVPLAQPPLAPGTYKLSWRGKGEDRRESGDDEEPTEEVVLPYDVNEINLLITDERDEVVAIYDGSDVDLQKADDSYPNGRLELIPWVEPKSTRDEEPPTPVDSIDVTVDVPCRKRGRVVRFVFGLEVAQGVVDSSWIGVE
jgi:sulfatase modifying factor 1